MIDETDIRRLLDAGCFREAFEQIVNRLGQKVFHLALSMTRNETVASDVAQDALLRVWKGLPGYNGSASISTWVYAITRNTCLTELKRAGSRPILPLDAPEYSATLEALAAPESGEAAADMDVEAMLARLSERSQRVLRLFYLEQKSYDETAVLLGVPVGTIKTHLFRARQEMVRLANQLETAPPHRSAV